MWLFETAGSAYTPATLTIFRDHITTACGVQSANTGPFYCPADHGVYLDTRFFDALGRAAGVQLATSPRPTWWPMSGHHVQVRLGVMQRVHDQQDPAGANARSVRLELQADCCRDLNTRYRRGQAEPGGLRGTRCERPRWSGATSSSARRRERSTPRTGPTARPSSASSG